MPRHIIQVVQPTEEREVIDITGDRPPTPGQGLEDLFAGVEKRRQQYLEDLNHKIAEQKKEIEERRADLRRKIEYLRNVRIQREDQERRVKRRREGPELAADDLRRRIDHQKAAEKEHRRGDSSRHRNLTKNRAESKQTPIKKNKIAVEENDKEEINLNDFIEIDVAE